MTNSGRRGFIRGLGGMFSFIDVINRRLFAETPAEADAEAIRDAWEEVGRYLYEAMGDYSRQTGIYVDENAATWNIEKTNNGDTSS